MLRKMSITLLTLGLVSGIALHAQTPPVTEEEDGGRIVGGEDAPPGTATWQIQLYSTFDFESEKKADLKRPFGSDEKLYLNERSAHAIPHRCGGSYIGDRWIITAAHCVIMPTIDGRKGNVLKDRRIRMGTDNLTAGGETFAIETVVRHATYKSPIPGSKDLRKTDDIALIRVADPTGKIPGLIRSGQLSAVTLQKANDPPMVDGDVLLVTGWGWTKPRTDKSATRLDRFGKVQQNPAQLQQVALLYYKDSKCANVPEYKNSWSSRAICAGSPDQGANAKDACQGDSGGPLTRQGREDRVLVGLVATGVGCAFKAIAGQYTRVSSYENWIKAAMAKPKGDWVLSHIN